MKLKSTVLVLAALAAAGPVTRAAEYHASSAAEVAQVAGKLQPGDVVILNDGQWKDQKVVFSGKGTAEKPVTLRAQTPGKVIFTGDSSVVIDGDYLVASGIYIKNGGHDGDGIAVKGTHNRLTESAMDGGTYKFFVHLYGSDIRMDHCYLAEKTSEDPTLQIEAPGEPNNDHIDHNLFGHRPPLGRNGGETMRVGYSWQSMNNSRAVVELNLFHRCDGEIEIISSKSCENIYRFNTFLDCGGMLTLRHGNRCRVEGNFMIGHHVKDAGGIRVIGEDHTIVNNYIEGVDKGGFWITCGWAKPILKSYFKAKNCVIAYNTIVDCRGPALDVDAGMDTNGRTLKPEHITIANDAFLVPKGGELIKGSEGENYTWAGNVAQAPEGTPKHDGITLADLHLQRAKDGLLRPGPNSPLRGAADENVASVKTDIDGQPRSDKPDAGCDQISDAPITNRPLTSADVGPSWMDRSGL